MAGGVLDPINKDGGGESSPGSWDLVKTDKQTIQTSKMHPKDQDQAERREPARQAKGHGWFRGRSEGK